MKAAIACLFVIAAAPASADELDMLVAAYPQSLARHDGDQVIFRSGSHLDAGPISASPQDRIAHASIRDMFFQRYPMGAAPPPKKDFDPGRFRNKAFFDAMYGDCRRGAVETNLVSITWLPNSWGHDVRVTRINGIAEQLKLVSDEIEKLPAAARVAAFPIAGGYSCRSVADQGQPSMHAYGAGIDLNLKYSGYWLWAAGRNSRIPYSNRMPQQIVDIFERHGFIWGGKWYHYDTMHFEYRPELTLAAGTASR